MTWQCSAIGCDFFADIGVVSLNRAQYFFAKSHHEIVSIVILLLPLIQEGMLSVTSESVCTKYCLV